MRVGKSLFRIVGYVPLYPRVRTEGYKFEFNSAAWELSTHCLASNELATDTSILLCSTVFKGYLFLETRALNGLPVWNDLVGICLCNFIC